MNRKQFLRQTLGAAAAFGLAKNVFGLPDKPLRRDVPQPPFLKPGDLIGITCPASPMEVREMLNCRTALNKWGFEVCAGNTVGQQWQRFGGSDAERASDLQLMLDDPSIKAILFARGGFGAMRMMDRIDWTQFKRHPKWLIGYSDLTAFHCHVQSQLGIPTIHGDMAISFKTEDDASTLSLQSVLKGERIAYSTTPHPQNRMGQATGILVGGNLSIVSAMLGSKSAIDTKGKILFLEEVSEYKYSIDRMMLSLKRAGMLDELAGMVIGGMTAIKADSETSYPATVEEIIFEKVKDYNYPVCFNFPSGHLSYNHALKFGIHYNFLVADSGTILNELHPMNPLFPFPVIVDSLENKF